MKIYSKEEWARQQYTGRWEASPWNLSRVEDGELHPYYIGRRNVMVGGIHGCTLLTEGLHFLIDGEYDNLPSLSKENAKEGACYRFPGGYIQVKKLYRIPEFLAEALDIDYLDRVDFMQYADWGSVPVSCALPGGDRLHT